MSGECGTLLYSGAVESFCKGVCYQRLRQLTEFYDTLKEEAVTKELGGFQNSEEIEHLQICEQISDKLKSVSQNYCYQNQDEAEERKKFLSPQSVYHNQKSSYCFATAHTDLAHLRSLNLYHRPDDIEIACKKKSCFRNNVDYLDSMWQLIHLPPVTTSKRTRQLRAEGGRDSEKKEEEEKGDSLEEGREAGNIYLSHLKEIENLPSPSQYMKEVLGFVLGEEGRGEEGRGEEGRGRRLDGNGLIGVAPVLNSIFGDPASVQYSDTVVPLMCLKDGEGQSCSSQFEEMLSSLSVWNGQMSLTVKDRFKLGQAVASLSTTCSDSSCFLQLSRHLGQQVSQRGTARGDPYQRFMGLFLKLFGRYFCQHDSQGSSCAVKYFGWLIQGMQPKATRPEVGKGSVHPPSEVGKEMLELLPNCDSSKCPHSYINDGICDPQCFNLACGYDGADCLVQNMYPGIIQRLMMPIPLTHQCHPLNNQLQTCPKDFLCHSTISKALVNNGCCFAVGVDMLKEVLDLEYYSHPLIRPMSELYSQASQYIDMDALRQLVLKSQHSRQISTSPSATDAGAGDEAADFSIESYDAYTPDRSSIYSQTLCNLYQDRTCSRGMARRILNIYFETSESPSYDALAWMMLRPPPAALRLTPFPYDEIDFQSFRKAVETELPVLRLKVLLRKSLSDLLVLPSTDIREVDIWPRQVNKGHQALVEIVVDPSLFLDETKNTLVELQKSGEFQDLISASVAQWRNGLSEILERFMSVMETRASRRRRLGEAAEVDQKKAVALDVEKVRQMPVTKITNVRFKIQTLDAIRVGKSGEPVDSLPPSEGTFDLGYIAGLHRTCSVRTLISELDPWGDASYPFNNYEVLTAGARTTATVTGTDGETLTLKCRGPTFAPAAGQADHQTVVCDNGRWLAADREPLLQCTKPCSHFHLLTPTPHVFRVVGDGHNAGSTRRVSCASGYSSTKGAQYEEITCKDGKWSPLTLECARAPSFDGACAGVPLDTLVSQFHYKMMPQLSGTGAKLDLPNAVWWKTTCQRGYEATSGTEPLYLICLDDRKLLSFGLMSYHLQQKVIKPPSNEGLESALRQFIADTMPSGQMAEVELGRLMWARELPLKPATSGGVQPMANLTSLVCGEAIITKPELLVESGIDDWVYIGVVAGIAFSATALFGAWGYYWQTRGRAKRNVRKAKALAAAAAASSNQDEAPLLMQPTSTAAEVVGKYPSTEASELFPSSKFPSLMIPPPPLPAPPALARRREDHSSTGYYSDVEYYSKHQS